MKITAPLSAVNEIDMLLHYGADEIYCGIQPPDWEKYFGTFNWMNRRAPKGANFTSVSDIRKVTEKAHDNGASVHIPLNASFYSEDGIEYVTGLAFKLVDEAHIDTVIINDLNLLLRLKEASFPANIHLSSLAGCMNSHAVSFYKSLGVKRIILPRQLQYREIERILKTMSDDMEFEIFAVNDGCYYEEAFCQTSHGVGGPFCLVDAKLQPICSDQSGITPQRLALHQDQYKSYLWFQNNCGSTYQEDGLPNGPCSLCGFGYFRDWGVTAMKVIGREASFYRKMRSLQIVKAVVDETRLGIPAKEIEACSKKIRNTPEYCEKGYMCYFRGN